MKNSKLLRIVALLLAMLMLVGCSSNAPATPTDNAGSASGDPIVLEYWSSWSETESQALVLKAAAQSFMDKHPNVKINFTFNGRDNRKLVVSAIEAGTQIDLMDANIDNVVKLWGENIKDVSEYMEKTYDTTNGKPYSECVIPSMAQLSSDLFGGKTMCVPYIPQAFMIFCNKNIFDEVGITSYPQTWDEFMDACEKIKAAGYIPITTDSNYATSWVGYYMSRLIGTDRVAEIVADRAAFKAEPGVLETAKAIEEMAQKGYFDPNIASNVYPAAQQDMVIGENIAMYINGTWLPNEVSATTADTYKWGSFAFPEVPGGVEGTEAGCYSTYAIAINKDCDDAATQMAFEFIVHITTGEWDQAFCDQANAIPMGIDATWPSNLADAQAVLNAYTKRYPSQTALIVNSDSKTIIAEACLKLMAGTITAEQFVEQAGNF